MSEETPIQGMREALKLLDEFPLKLAKNTLRGALRAAAKPIVTAARAAVPVLKVPDGRRIAGALKKSIRAMSTRIQGTLVQGGVAAGSTKARGLGDAFYAHFIEKGTVKMAARPFLRPAGDTQAGAAGDALVDYVKQRYEKEALK